MKYPSPPPHNLFFLWCEMSHLHNARVTVGSKLKLYTDFLSYSKSVTCQSEHVRHPVLARWVERWRRQVSANQPMCQFYPSDPSDVIIWSLFWGWTWCQGCESLQTTRDRLSTKDTANDVLWWVPATCLHRPAVMTSCSTYSILLK